MAVIKQKPWESKKWVAAAAGFAVLTAEVMLGVDIPQEAFIGQVVLLLGYLLGQSWDDAKAKPEALRLEALKLEAELGKRPS